MLFAMHIPEHILDPATATVTWIAALVCLGYAVSQLRWSAGERPLPLVGVVAAGIFAGQMVNFPIVGLPASGHLLGGVLAGVLVGPWAGALAVTAVLVVQCLLFGDGGLSALGANILNMAVVGSMVGYALYAGLRRMVPGSKGIVLAAVIASWFSVTLASVAFSVELAAGGDASFDVVVRQMLFYHTRIGLGEALITGALVAAVLQVRPDLIYDSRHPWLESAHLRKVVVSGMALSLAVAIFASPFASEFDDGLEAVLGELGIQSPEATTVPAPFPDYSLRDSLLPSGNLLADPWRAALVTAMLGALGTIVTWGVASGMARSMRIAKHSA